MLQSNTERTAHFFSSRISVCVCRRPKGTNGVLGSCEPPCGCRKLSWESSTCSELLSHLFSHRTACFISKCFWAGYDSVFLQPQHLRGWDGRYAKSLKSARATEWETLSLPPLPKSSGPMHLGNENKFISVEKLSYAHKNSDAPQKSLYKNQVGNLRCIFIRKNRFHGVKPVNEQLYLSLKWVSMGLEHELWRQTQVMLHKMLHAPTMKPFSHKYSINELYVFIT